MTVGSSNAGQRGGNRPGDDRARQSDPPRATIVVLDDDLVFRRGVARILRSEGYDVVEVEDGAELDVALTNGSVDLIVADSRLADGSDGWLEAKGIARRHGDVPVLAITGYDPDAIAAVGGFTGTEFVQKEGAGFNIVRAVEAALAGR